MKEKQISIKIRLICMAVIPVFTIGLTLLIISSIKIKTGMMDEALDGLMASAKLYREEILTTGRDLTTNELEDEYKAVTGYDFTRFEGDTRAATSVVKADGSRPIGTQAAEGVVKAVIQGGNDYTSEKTDVAGQEYCVAYAPIKDETGAVTGMAFAGKPTVEMEKAITKSVTLIVVVGTIILIITCVVVILVANKLVSVITCVNNTVSNLSEGKFQKADKFTQRGDELGNMIRSSNILVDKLSNVVTEIKDASNQTGEQSKELASTTDHINDTCINVSTSVQEMAKGANELAESVQKATENITMLSDAIQSVAENAEQLAGSAAEMSDASTQSADALGNLSNNMQTLGEAVQEISNTMQQTNEAVNSVNEKVDGITSIASQTNLLALNASIEAARAGEAGKGFAVVAEEIGKLATESSTTAQQIREEMANLLKHSHDATSKTEEITTIKNDVENVLNDTTGIINTLIDNVGTTVDGINTISGLTEECNASKEQINDAMSSMSAVSEQNAASTEQTAASMAELSNTINNLTSSAESLNNIASTLNEALQFFQV